MGWTGGPANGDTATTGTVDPYYPIRRAFPLSQADTTNRAFLLSQANTTKRAFPLALLDESAEPHASTVRPIDTRTPRQHPRASPPATAKPPASTLR